MIHQIGLKLREQIDKFSGELSRGLCKARRRFVGEMLYGIPARGSVRLTEVARSLSEPIRLKKTHERLCRNLSDAEIREVVGKELLRQGSARVSQDTLLVVDLSDLSKKYAQKMEYLAEVRDGSENQIGRGYHLCEVVGAQVGSSEIIPLSQALWSQAAPDFVSENAELLSQLRGVRSATGGRGIYVMDRGGDRGELYDELVPGGYRFLLRQRGDRHLLYQGKKVETRLLAELCRMLYAETIVKEEKDGKERIYHLEFGYLPVRLPEWPEAALWLVVIKGFGEKPMMLLTTEPMRRSRKVVWWAGEAYLIPPKAGRVEETIRFLKQSYQLEDVRVLTYESLKDLAMLVFACFFFAAIYLGARAKLRILVAYVLKAGKRLFGIPDFRYYALADGIREILFRVGKGPVQARHPEIRGDPQMTLLDF
jgi:hypothetical protein